MLAYACMDMFELSNGLNKLRLLALPQRMTLFPLRCIVRFSGLPCILVCNQNW